jgi:hypothetical protein
MSRPIVLRPATAWTWVAVHPCAGSRPDGDLDLEHCTNCGCGLKIIAAILEQPVIEKILAHLGLQAQSPPSSPARGQAMQTA